MLYTKVVHRMHVLTSPYLSICHSLIIIYESSTGRLTINSLTHHKPVPGFKNVEWELLTWNDDIHDKKRHQINTKVCQTVML